MVVAVDEHEHGVRILSRNSGGSFIELGTGSHDDVITAFCIFAEGGFEVGRLNSFNIFHLRAEFFVAFYNTGIVGSVPALVIDLARKQQDDLRILRVFRFGCKCTYQKGQNKQNDQIFLHKLTPYYDFSPVRTGVVPLISITKNESLTI